MKKLLLIGIVVIGTILIIKSIPYITNTGVPPVMVIATFGVIFALVLIGKGSKKSKGKGTWQQMAVKPTYRRR